MTQQIGDDQAGFSVTYDRSNGTLNVRAWGFWSAPVAAQFGNAVADACRNSAPGTALIMDMNDLKPMRDEGQVSFGKLMKALPRMGLSKTTVTTSSHLTKLQLLRLASEFGAKDFVQFS